MTVHLGLSMVCWERSSEMDREVVLGIDTSNYTTSVALVTPSKILSDERKMLEVREGERGLRQSDALFQHVRVLPDLLESLMKGYGGSISAVAAASRPRPVKGSYMPVFLPGQSVGRSIAASLSVPYFEFSHQEGHIEAILPDGWRDFHCFHMSGGTTELLSVKNGRISIIGGSKDISIGQLIDRIGVDMGFAFPAGREMDNLAGAHRPSRLLKKIPVKERWMNLSGMETQCRRALERGAEMGPLAAEIFVGIAEGICKITGEDRTLLAGGVSSSRTLKGLLAGKDHLRFPQGDLGRDNAVGIARLGGKQIWR